MQDLIINNHTGENRMYKLTNVGQLGTDYTVADATGNIIKTMQIIPHYEILDAALGEYDESFGSYSDYLDKSIAALTGFEDVNLNTVLWYSTTEEDVKLYEIIEYAVNNGYDKIVLEYLDNVDEQI